MSPTPEPIDDGVVRAAETMAGLVKEARGALAAVIFGQDEVVERAFVTLLSGGHGLLVGLPALPKRSWSKVSASCWGSTPSASSSRPT